MIRSGPLVEEQPQEIDLSTPTLGLSFFVKSSASPASLAYLLPEELQEEIYFALDGPPLLYWFVS